MREIMKILPVPVDGKPMDFRLTKLDAFSGVSLLRMMANLPDSKCHSERSEESFLSFFAALSDADLRSLMTTCLQHAEVLLPAGWMPVMTRGEWTFPELEHDIGFDCLTSSPILSILVILVIRCPIQWIPA